MSLLFDADNDQVKVTLASALTIADPSDYVVSFWVYYTSLPADLGNTMAILDVDPGGAGRRVGWTDSGNEFFTDEDGGGFGAYTVTTGTWYHVVYQHTWIASAGTGFIRIFPDSTSSTPLNGSGAGETASDNDSFTTLDTIIFGDIQPSARNARRMEIISLKVQTGISGGWSNAECVTERQKIDIQKAGGTDRYAWLLEDTDSDITGLNERGGSGPNFALSGGTVTVGSNRPTQLEAAGGGGGGGVPTYKPVKMFPVGNTPMIVAPAGRNLFNFINV